jgi:hypothetical protein
MKLIFMLRTALDTRSVINRTCATCKHLYVDPVDEWTTCELKVAIVSTFHMADCPKYIYIRSPKKL